MRSPIFIFAAVLAAAQTPGTKEYQAAVCPDTPLLEIAPSSKHWLEGAIGQRRIRMYLERGGEAVVGAFYDPANWIPFTFGGRWIDGGVIEVTARTENDTPAGQLHGRITTSGFAGSWTPQGSAKSERVRLKTGPQPECDRFTGAWRPFSDPRWPVTFSYPDSWRLEVHGDSLTLMCTDAEAMAYSDFNIRVTQGSSANESPGAFVRCAGEWRYGRQCDCDDLSACRVAEINRGNGMTVLGGDEMEWRVYCRNGGYVAQGFGYDRLLLIDNGWVDLSGQGPPSEMIAEIVKTVRRRQRAKQPRASQAGVAVRCFASVSRLKSPSPFWNV